MSGTNHSDAGLTLVEVLVVLVIVGVLASAVALNVGALDRGGARLEREADLLAARLTRAAEETLVSGETATLIWDDESYRFLTLKDGDWVAHPVPILGQRQEIASGFELSSDGMASGSYRLRPDMTPAATGPLLLTLAAGANRAEVVFDGLSARHMVQP